MQVAYHYHDLEKLHLLKVFDSLNSPEFSSWRLGAGDAQPTIGAGGTAIAHSVPAREPAISASTIE